MMSYLSPTERLKKEYRKKLALVAAMYAATKYENGMTLDDVVDIIRSVTGEDDTTTMLATFILADAFRAGSL